MLREFLRGFRVLHFVGPCVTVFGSARVAENSSFYALARQLGTGLRQQGFTVLTGGGPGLMEAANHDARDAGGPSIGCNIVLPTEQHPQPLPRPMADLPVFLRAQGPAGQMRWSSYAGRFRALNLRSC